MFFVLNGGGCPSAGFSDYSVSRLTNIMDENGKKSYPISCHRNSKPLTDMDIYIPILLENKHE